MGILERLQAEINAARLGATQGVLMGWGDELKLGGTADEYAQARRDAPVGFLLGEVAGSIPWAFLGSRAAKLANKKAGRFTMAAGLGALHGMAYGSGAGEKGWDATAADRLEGIATSGLLGAGVGALSPTATKIVGDVADNLPALLGRQRVYNDAGRDFVRQAGLGQGTRGSAPLDVFLAGEGTAAQRAQTALGAVASQDEALAMRAGKQMLGRQGETAIPWQSGERATRSLVDYATGSPGGSSVLGQMADEMAANRLTQQAKRLAPPTGAKVGGARTRGIVEDLAAFADQPQAHESWLGEVAKLAPAQRAAVGARLVRQAKADPAKLADPKFLEKLAATGARSRPAPNAKTTAAADEQSIRSRLAKRDAPAFANPDDLALAMRGTLTDEDAAALLLEALRSRRVFAVRPDSGSRALRGQYRQGMQWRPGGYLGDVTPEQLEMAVKASQPAAAALHGLPYVWGERDR